MYDEWRWVADTIYSKYVRRSEKLQDFKEDIKNEAWVGIMEGLGSYDQEKGATLKGHVYRSAWRCARNFVFRLITKIRFETNLEEYRENYKSDMYCEISEYIKKCIAKDDWLLFSMANGLYPFSHRFTAKELSKYSIFKKCYNYKKGITSSFIRMRIKKIRDNIKNILDITKDAKEEVALREQES